MTSQRIAIVIAAAGSGTRFGSELPKQYCLLEGVPVVVHAIRRFQKALPDAPIVAVVAADRLDYWAQLCSDHSLGHVPAVAGGDTRWASVKSALELISPHRDIVMIHDGARPLVDSQVISRLLDALIPSEISGALPVLPMTDSLRQLRGNSQSSAVDRSEFVAVQTPQAFRLDQLRQSYKSPYSPLMTDDASVMEAAGFTGIALVEGSEATLKITRPIDLDIAALHLRK